MSDVHAIAQELCGDEIFMVDLAKASLHITDKFHASAVLFSLVEFVFDDKQSKVSQQQVWEFKLPTRDDFPKRDSRPGSPKTKATPDRGLNNWNDLLSEKMLEYTENFLNFYMEKDERNDDRKVRDAFSVKHFAKYDSSDKIWIHFLSFSKLIGDRTGGVHKIMAIVECGRQDRAAAIRYHKKTNPAVSDAIIKDGFKEYRNFLEILPDSSRINGVIEEFILLKSFFDKKLRTMSYISNKVIKASWQHMLTHGTRNTNLPWEIKSAGNGEPGSNVLTVTVSLDLRKSTSMMEQAESQPGYAMWLEALSEICRDITLHNSGIFDKFTGDGIIAHFVCLDGDGAADGDELRDRDCHAAEIIDHAFTCACELVRAVGMHHQAIKPYLRFNIEAAGVAVGIAIDQAAWSLDRDGRPVVVGKGVVNACRLNGGNPGTIRLAYNMRRHLPQVSFDVVVVEDHKDLNPALRPQCYLSCGANMQHGRDDPALRVLVDKLASEVRTRHQLRRDRREEAANRPIPPPSSARR